MTLEQKRMGLRFDEQNMVMKTVGLDSGFITRPVIL